MLRFVLFALIILAVAGGITLFQKGTKEGKINEPNLISPSITQASIPRVSIIAERLETPWAIDFLPASPLASRRSGQGGPNGDILFTERKGSLKLLSKGQVSTIAALSDVLPLGEGGLMGLTLHPDFEESHYLFVMYTFQGKGDNTLNRIARYKYENGKLSGRTIIVDNIPGGLNHNGGRIKFGPDGFLYATTGDSGNPSLSQDKNSLAGKILRVDIDGNPAPGNPFNNLVYSYGHRNPQGLAWDNEGRLWETEHGPSGVWPNCCQDEVNIIEKGVNYGWPTIVGNQTRDGMESPFSHSGQETWAPAGTVYSRGLLFFGGLRGEALYQYDIQTKQLTALFKNEFGRIRDVVLGPDNFLYITTSNRDGRGNPKSNDDKILKIGVFF